jgi:peptidoglycan/xylan/chitin deacetylase (PgdA/CDA1 family)
VGQRVVKRYLVLTAVIVALIAAAYGSLYAVYWGRLAAADCRLTALMYHELTPYAGGATRYGIHVDEFARQMDELRAAGAVTRPIDDVLQAWRAAEAGGCPFLPNEVVITFDLHGGSRHHYLALPHLERNGLIAHFFIVTGDPSRPVPLPIDLADVLVAAGMIFGSHTETHPDLPAIPTEVLIPSLERSRARLASLSRQPITSLAAPGGRYDERVLQDVEAAGFEAFFTSDPCYVERESSPFRLCRIEIRGDRGMSAVAALRSPQRVALQATHWRLKRLVEGLIGTDRFRGLSRVATRLRGA